MFRHNLLLIYRNFKRFKSTFLINLTGLSTALACVLLIYLWVKDEVDKDKFHEHEARLFQVMELQQYENSLNVTNSTPWLLAETIKEEFPEVEFAATASLGDWFEPFTLSVNDKSIKASARYVGKDFFKMFSYPLVEGAASQVLADKSSIVISEKLALSLFEKSSDLVGKTVQFQHEKEFIVSGVFRNTNQSSEQFDFAVNYQLLIDEHPQVTDWKNAGPSTYVVLRDGAEVEVFNKKIYDLIRQKSNAKNRSLFATKYSDLYLHGDFKNGVQTGGRIDYVILFSCVAAFILCIACINFMNLSTAKASGRMKEVGVKKAVGASRSTLVVQYLGESLSIVILSVMLAILFVDLLLPKFNVITGKNLFLNFDGQLLTAMVVIIFLTGVFAGSYPAFYLSAFKPVAILKGKLTNTWGELWVRRGLVVFQFTLSVILIGVVLVVQQQIHYVLNKNIGYQKENILYFEIEGRVKEKRETFLTEVRNIPGVERASSMAQSMVGGGNTTNIEWEGKAPDLVVPLAIRPVNYEAIEIFGLNFIEGRPFSRDHADSLAVIFNQTAIDIIGLENPVGQSVNLGGIYNCKIIGIVDDFNYESLHSNVGPMFFLLAPEFTGKIMVKIQDGKLIETISNIQRLYQEFNPGFAFEYRFIGEDYQNQYQSELRVGTLSKYFAAIAILISCLGLFGLAAFTAERRVKEIGIRKVMGASESSIVILISGDFTKLVLLSIILAMPVAYLLSQNWLNDFQYKINLSWFYFAGAGIIALVIACLTVGTHAIRAAKANPANCLKVE